MTRIQLRFLLAGLALLLAVAPVNMDADLSIRPQVACGQLIAECEFHLLKVCSTPVRDIMFYRYVGPF
ncbi:MAG: hypothetical protein F4139_09260 [Gemmatimonadetes bacterium]|nr:hypothetical protein [Gemmatimonadota bacterium]MYA64463.1 hypothetical protein [Gemmatimonadota bacterium]MYB98219.1 hypothetical protein [Gemmatimonadota bacterium]MYH53126.1 hypothetical protein [Gemmatimonadota bacterium]MYI44960.1 hypothetical protein [Gemmatimonadota bacterium]